MKRILNLKRNIFGFELDDNHRREIENSTPVLGGGITLEHTLRERVSHRNQPPPRIEDKQSEDQDRNLLMMQIKVYHILIDSLKVLT